jgi:hypothetical protein
LGNHPSEEPPSLIANPSIFSRTIHQRTWLPFSAGDNLYPLPKALSKKTNYKKNPATNPLPRETIIRLPEPISIF